VLLISQFNSVSSNTKKHSDPYTKDEIIRICDQYMIIFVIFWNYKNLALIH